MQLEKGKNADTKPAAKKAPGTGTNNKNKGNGKDGGGKQGKF